MKVKLIALVFISLLSTQSAYAQFGNFLKDLKDAADSIQKNLEKPEESSSTKPQQAPSSPTTTAPSTQIPSQAPSAQQTTPQPTTTVSKPALDPKVRALQVAYNYRKADPEINSAFNKCVKSETSFSKDNAKKIRASEKDARTTSEQKTLQESAKFADDNAESIANGFCVARLILGARRATTGLELYEFTWSAAEHTEKQFNNKELTTKANKVVAETLDISAQKWRSSQLSDLKKMYKQNADFIAESREKIVVDDIGKRFIDKSIQ